MREAGFVQRPPYGPDAPVHHVGWSNDIAPGPGLHDRLLICTDGLTRELGDAEIGAVLAQVADAQDAANELVRRSLDAGARDNVSAVVVDVATSAGALDDVHITVPRAGSQLGPHLWDEMLHGATVPRTRRPSTSTPPSGVDVPSQEVTS